MHPPAIDRINDVAGAETDLQRAAVLIHCGNHKAATAQALEQRAAAFDFNDFQARQLCHRLCLATVGGLRRGDANADALRAALADDAELDFVADRGQSEPRAQFG